MRYYFLAVHFNLRLSRTRCLRILLCLDGLGSILQRALAVVVSGNVAYQEFGRLQDPTACFLSQVSFYGSEM